MFAYLKSWRTCNCWTLRRGSGGAPVLTRGIRCAKQAVRFDTLEVEGRPLVLPFPRHRYARWMYLSSADFDGVGWNIWQGGYDEEQVLLKLELRLRRNEQFAIHAQSVVMLARNSMGVRSQRLQEMLVLFKRNSTITVERSWRKSIFLTLREEYMIGPSTDHRVLQPKVY